MNTTDTKRCKAVFEAKMDYGNGNSSWLDVTIGHDAMNNKVIYFQRNEQGVHAWHCGSLPITDYRILEIREKKI